MSRMRCGTMSPQGTSHQDERGQLSRVAEAAASHTLLQSLTLPGTQIGLSGFRAIGLGLAAANCSLTELDLCPTNGTHVSVTAYADRLATNTKLRFLKLGSCVFDSFEASLGMPP